MSGLAGHVGDYLRLRRALGFKLTHPGQVLPEFAAWLQAQGLETITVEAALEWVRLSHGQAISLSHRLGAIRGFARYMRTIDSATQVPPTGIFGKQRRYRPYIYSEAEIAGLLDAARGLRPRLRAATFEALFSLLTVTGMRISEALHVARTDVDLTGGLVTVRHPKFDRDRLVPIHASLCDLLGQYAQVRDTMVGPARVDTFFTSMTGTALSYNAAHDAFTTMLKTAGLPTEAGNRPRIHDLRHSKAIHTLIAWQRDGADVAALLPVLSTYLGHVSPASTYWYFSAVPELMAQAAAHLENHSSSTPGDPS